MNNAEEYKLVRQVIGINVGTIRKQRKLSQAKLAESISVDRSYVNQLEGGKENVTVDILVKLADGLDVPLTTLLTGLHLDPPYKLDRAAINYAYVPLDGSPEQSAPEGD